jgi:hypothetical protein
MRATGALFASPHFTSRAPVSDFSEATFTGEAEIYGKLVADGTSFNKSLVVDAEGTAFTAKEPDVLLKNSTIKNDITATVRRLVLDNSSAKTVTIIALKDHAGNDLPTLVEVKGKSSVDTLVFKNGKGKLLILNKGKMPKKVVGGTVLKMEELTPFIKALGQQVKQSEQAANKIRLLELQQKAVEDEARGEEIQKAAGPMIQQIRETAEKLYRSFNQYSSQAREFDRAMDRANDNFAELMRAPWYESERAVLKKYPELYKLLEHLDELDHELRLIQQRTKQREALEAAV